MKKYLLRTANEEIEVNVGDKLIICPACEDPNGDTPALRLSTEILEALCEVNILMKVEKKVEKKVVESKYEIYDIVKEALHRGIPLTMESYLVFLNESQAEGIDTVNEIIKNGINNMSLKDCLEIHEVLLNQIHTFMEMGYDEDSESEYSGYIVDPVAMLIYKVSKDYDDEVKFRTLMDAHIALYIFS